jgi:two-component system phosphate regulon response regulator PhoB
MVRAPRILLVEDEGDIRELIRLRLEREGYAVTEAGDGEIALQLLTGGGEAFDLHLFDWMLPRMSGLELTRTLRAAPLASRAPILMVTARNEAADIVAGLEAGADDYVTKPFEIPVLLARVRALLRRAAAPAVSAGAASEGLRLEAGALRLDLGAHEVRCGDELVALTPSEFKLLAALLQNQGRVLTRQQLIDLVQGVGVSVVDRAVDTHVFGLRKKLGACGELIETVRGVGYRVRTG